MRTLLIVLGLVVWAHVASAATVVVLSDPQSAPALGSALEVTLAGRGVAVATLPAPNGGLRLDRAASAQHAAQASNADVAVWIDHDPASTEVCAVTADGRYFRHAPLVVGETDTPRMFAAIATSLLDELITDQPGIDVDVRVNVSPDAHPPVAMIEPPSIVAPAVVAPATGDGRLPIDNGAFEVGPSFGLLSAGVEAGVMFPLGRRWLVGGSGSVQQGLFQTNGEYGQVFAVTGELRHVGRGRHHWDVGPVAGYFYYDQNGANSPFAGARIAYAWNSEHHASSIGFEPCAFYQDRLLPIAFASYRLELPF